MADKLVVPVEVEHHKGLKRRSLIMTIKVTQDVFDGLEEVRASGETNMFDVGAVQYWAFQFNHYATVAWLEDNSKKYMSGVFEGFEVVDQ